MAIPTPVNGQITDSITQQNIEVIGSAPGQAMAELFQASASAMGLAFQNAVTSQQNINTLASAVTTRCVSALLPNNP